MATALFNGASRRSSVLGPLRDHSAAVRSGSREALMSVVTLCKAATQPLKALPTPFEVPRWCGYGDVVDLSALTAPKTFSSGLAWVELPTLGADGRITG